MKATVFWRGNLAFAGETESGFAVPLDAEAAAGGENGGPRPMELIALGLAGCTAMDVIAIVRKKRQVVSRFEVRVDAPRAEEHPRVFTSAVITYVISGKAVDEAAVLRAIELSATRYCPAQTMLKRAFPMELRYEIYEDEENGSQTLVHRGAWQATAAE